jgi:hypothetical protein
MPYAPGIQDISGQLIGEGMTRASNIRAQARSDFGKTIADTLVGGIKQYQQNESFTQQSLAKFTERMQDPVFNKYVNNILADESNTMGVPESIKTAFRNAQTGKLKPNEASTLATIAQDYSERKKASEESDFRRMQTALAFAQAQGALTKANAAPVGRIMTQEEYQKFLKVNPELSANAVPLGDGTVLMKTLTGRVPEKQDVISVNTGGETILIDKNTGQTVRTITNTSPMPPGFERVPGGPAVAPTASAIAPPASLGQFMQSQSMAPSQMGLLASQGGAGMQSAPAASPANIAAINAVQAAQGAAPAITPAPAGLPAAIAPAPVGGVQPMAIRPIAGSPAAIEAQQKTEAEKKARDALQGNIDTTMDTIKKIERSASKYSVGAPGITNLPRAVGKFFNIADSANVEALLKTLEGSIAFDALRNLKESGTSLGQIAIRELELLKASKGSLEQSLSYPLFMENLNRLKIRTEYAGKKLQALNSALEKGLTEPTKEFYKLDEQQNAALKALEKTPEQRLKDRGFTIKRPS